MLAFEVREGESTHFFFFNCNRKEEGVQIQHASVITAMLVSATSVSPVAKNYMISFQI